jgi:ubiquinone/menaquinone biosynthesis C-methylase UbiE
MTEWFEEWFGEEYLQLYPHRDAAEAERAVALILARVGFAPGWRVLDVACGAGRHARAFEAAVARCVGLDLSAALLRVARGVTAAPLVRADMRALPVRPGSMDLTVNLFTSFGYFERDAEHAAALHEMVSERVRLFAAEEIETMLADAGVAVHHRFGDYDASTPRPDSPRTILLGQTA